MSCCTRYCAAEEEFDRKRAESDLRHYRQRGADGITRILLQELTRFQFQDKQLLDIGCGIGIVSLELAANGLAGATLVEASRAYLETAQQEVKSRYAPRPTQFHLGDFALIADTLPDADVVTLDRVVCCYPDAKALLQTAAARTRDVLAFTYPRDRWYNHAYVALQNLPRRMRGSPFRVLVHPVQEMCATLENAGLTHTAHRETLVWAMDLYRRS